TRVELKLRGETVTYRIGDGYKSEIQKKEAQNAAVANFVHSSDATHLIMSVNAAHAAGIRQLVTVHDCYGTIAPRVVKFQKIVRSELSKMYRRNDLLAKLWAQNGAPNDIDLPEEGRLNPLAVQFGSYPFT